MFAPPPLLSFVLLLLTQLPQAVTRCRLGRREVGQPSQRQMEREKKGTHLLPSQHLLYMLMLYTTQASDMTPPIWYTVCTTHTLGLNSVQLVPCVFYLLLNVSFCDSFGLRVNTAEVQISPLMLGHKGAPHLDYHQSLKMTQNFQKSCFVFSSSSFFS